MDLSGLRQNKKLHESLAGTVGLLSHLLGFLL